MTRELSKPELLDLYRQMVLIRRFVEKSAELYAEGKIGVFLHLYIGEEAIAVGACKALHPTDHLFTAYRDHGWQRCRFAIKPGLTGWWQVNGRPQPMYEHVEYDIYYVDHRCMRLDLIILLCSARAILSGEGAV